MRMFSARGLGILDVLNEVLNQTLKNGRPNSDMLLCSTYSVQTLDNTTDIVSASSTLTFEYNSCKTHF
jgi:hypothetical protein